MAEGFLKVSGCRKKSVDVSGLMALLIGLVKSGITSWAVDVRARRAQMALIRVDLSIFRVCGLDGDDVEGTMFYRNLLFSSSAFQTVLLELGNVNLLDGIGS